MTIIIKEEIYCPLLVHRCEDGVTRFGKCYGKSCACYETREEDEGFKPKCVLRTLISISEDLNQIKTFLQKQL